jgi:hypothetical protein
MRDLCDAWKNTGRVDKLATEAMSFAEVKKLLGVEEVQEVSKQMILQAFALRRKSL